MRERWILFLQYLVMPDHQLGLRLCFVYVFQSTQELTGTFCVVRKGLLNVNYNHLFISLLNYYYN